MAEKRKLAFYIRLSDADEEVKAGTKDESNSITGQRKLLYAYIKKTEEFAGFEVLEYFDDGYSGTMFNNRAEFQRLIQDAELGRFECIIVKDFSRFGRDYLEVGNYLEFVFPAMGMRFISVNDNYDSDRNFGVTGGMDVAYKNLIYQLYSMDLSRKVKSARRTRNLSGEYTASFVCYGYKKDPDDKHKLIIDEEAAKVVVEIFSLIIAGYNASEVARILNERKIPTRVQNQWKNGINYVPVHNKGDYMWDNSEVIAIVQNEQYKGIMIQNKCETVGFGDNKKVRKRNKEDWSVVEGAIPRIVSDEMFDEVNKMLRVEARGIEKSTKKRKKNLFICPYCGRKLMNSSAVCTPKLLCPKRRMVRTGECQQIFMLKSEAQDKVLEITKEICRTLIQEEELKRASKDKRKVTSDEYLISELKAEYDRISNSTVSCYQSYREGKYTKEEYVQLRKTNQELLADLENQISDLQEKAANQEPDTEEKIEQINDDYNTAVEEMEKNIQEEKNQKENEEEETEQDKLNERGWELEKNHRYELYTLDISYYTDRLEALKKKKTAYCLTSGMNGVIVSAGSYMPGTYIAADTPLIAVADESQKILKCEYVSKSDVAKCEDLYAVIDGKRYEVTYQPYDQSVYEKITTEGNVAYSSFVIEDPNNEVEQGDFAVLAEIYSRVEQVLSIPKSAVHKDAKGAYVYCVVNGESKYTQVKTGKDDGTYIEIIDGLKEGDLVLLSENNLPGDNTAEVKRGDFSSEFEGSAFIAYPISDSVINPVSYGTMYFTEYQVELFQTVKAGDVIAKVHVENDEAELLEKQLQLQRQTERMADAVEAGESENLLAGRQKTIDKLKNTIMEMQQDADTVTITAQTDGIIFWLADLKAEDEIEQGAAIAMIAESSNCFLTVQNENQQLNYGNTVQVEYNDLNQVKCQTEGKVVTSGAAGLTAGLKSEAAYIKLPQEVLDVIVENTLQGNTDYYRNSQFEVRTEIRKMSNVLLIPKQAVKEKNGNTYVYIKNSDGTVTAQSFIAGGSNQTEYWVLEGLEEGMTICLE